MKTNNINIPTWLLRFSSTPLIVYTTFKEFGFFKGLKILYNYTHVYFYFWFIRNCKWYRNKLHKRLKNLCGEEGEILFDMMVDMPNCDPKKILNKYPKFRQEFIKKFEENKQSIIDDHIKSGELKTEEEIQEFSEQLKLENFI